MKIYAGNRLPNLRDFENSGLWVLVGPERYKYWVYLIESDNTDRRYGYMLAAFLLDSKYRDDERLVDIINSDLARPDYFYPAYHPLIIPVEARTTEELLGDFPEIEFNPQIGY